MDGGNLNEGLFVEGSFEKAVNNTRNLGSNHQRIG